MTCPLTCNPKLLVVEHRLQLLQYDAIPSTVFQKFRVIAAANFIGRS